MIDDNQKANTEDRQDEARDRDLHFRQPVLSATDNSSPSDERRAISFVRTTSESS